MRIFVTAFSVLCVSAGLSTQAASFDCAKASSRIEKSICDSPQLSKLDSDLGEAYKSSLARASDPQSEKNTQKAWLQSMRNTCQDASCLVAAYQQRIAAFSSVATAELENRPGTNILASTPSKTVGKQVPAAAAEVKKVSESSVLQSSLEKAILEEKCGELKKAFKLLTELAAEGNPSALAHLGALYTKDSDFYKKDQAKGRELLLGAASHGDKEANGLLGAIYEYGTGIPVDLTKAVEWYRKGAEAGDPYSISALGFLNSEGKGVSRDLKLAFDLYERSANLGWVHSQQELVKALIAGNGTTKNYRTAYFWSVVASNQGSVDAYRNRLVFENFSRNISDQDIVDVPKEAAEWVKKEVRPFAPKACETKRTLKQREGDYKNLDRWAEEMKPRAEFVRGGYIPSLPPLNPNDPNELLILRIEAKGGNCPTVAGHMRSHLIRARQTGDWSGFRETLGRGSQYGC